MIMRNAAMPKDNPLTHYEVYPMEQDPYDTEPEFTILVPVMKGI